MCVCGHATRARCAECRECAAGSVRRRECELAVRDVLTAHESTTGFVWNAKLRGTRYRPDFLWTFPDACVLLEVDEDGHRGYDTDAERAREREICARLGRPVRIIRMQLPRGATHETVTRAAELLVPTLATRIADAQEYAARIKIRS